MFKRGLFLLGLLLLSASVAQAQAPTNGDLSEAADCVPTFNLVPASPDANFCTPLLQISQQYTYQPFERGFMIWRSDVGDVLVFSKPGTLDDFFEKDYALLPDNPITLPPPKGRSAPAHGFGRVWGSDPDIRSAVGWALGPEISYTATIQSLGYPITAGYFFVSLPNNEVVRILKWSNWAFVTPERD